MCQSGGRAAQSHWREARRRQERRGVARDGNVAYPSVVITNVGVRCGKRRGAFLHISRDMGKTDASGHQNDLIADTPGEIAHAADSPAIHRTVRGHLASKRVRSDRMARRPNAAVGVVCPRCGMLAARIIGRSESLPVIYLQCEDCGRTSVAPSGEQA
jgi:hypothetical protein